MENCHICSKEHKDPKSTICHQCKTENFKPKEWSKILKEILKDSGAANKRRQTDASPNENRTSCTTADEVLNKVGLKGSASLSDVEKQILDEFRPIIRKLV